MKVEFHTSFDDDLKAIESKKVRDRVRSVIKEVESAQLPQVIHNLIKLRGFSSFFRIRVGDYRIGIELDKETVIFVRVLRRRDFYRFFP